MSTIGRHRYVFVGGLHRSGTSLVAGILAGHPEVAAIRDAPVPENEGVYLQGAIPHTARSGRPGHFAEDPAQHLVEGCVHDRLETRQRMEADWAAWFDPGRPWRVEKSPVNLLRARLYQQLFPLAQFVFVVRHPLAAARATAKWTDRDEPQLLAHWATAHRLLVGDLPYLHCWLVVRYEDLCADPGGEAARLWRFLRLSPPEGATAVAASSNADYLARGGAPAPPPAAASVWRAFGYDLEAADPVAPCRWRERHYYQAPMADPPPISEPAASFHPAHDPVSGSDGSFGGA